MKKYISREQRKIRRESEARRKELVSDALAGIGIMVFLLELMIIGIMMGA